MQLNSTAASVFAYALHNGADFAELFLEDRDDVSIDYTDRVNEVSRMRSFGAGLYLLKGNSGA
jgi:predicted Zn-dependent protease